MRRCAVIVNPTSGSFREKTVSSVLQRLREGGLEAELLLTRSADDPSSFARALSSLPEPPLLVAAGGDGTVNGVVNGMEPGRGTLAVLPLGTSNVLARELGISSVKKGVERIIRGHSRMFHAGRLESSGSSMHFLLMAGIGYDAATVQTVRKGEKRRLGPAAYLLSALRLLRAWDSRMQEVTVDGEPLSCHTVIVCNVERYAGRFRLAPGTDLFTPGFRVVCITSPARTVYLSAALRLAAGLPLSMPGVATLQGKTVTISGGKPVQLDGDFASFAPAVLRSVENFGRLIV